MKHMMGVVLVALMAAVVASAESRVGVVELSNGKKYMNLILLHEANGSFFFRDSRGRPLQISGMQLTQETKARCLDALRREQRQKNVSQDVQQPSLPTNIIFRARIGRIFSDGFIPSACEEKKYRRKMDQPRPPTTRSGRVIHGASYGSDRVLWSIDESWEVRHGNMVIRGIKPESLIRGEIWEGKVIESGIEEIDGERYRAFKAIQQMGSAPETPLGTRK